MRSMLRNFPTEKVTLIKKDGSILENIEALVQTGKIFIEDTSLKDLARSIDSDGHIEGIVQELRDNVGKKTYAEKYN